jgi:glycosyltransferase involved in cell wall biosynthesis
MRDVHVDAGVVPAEAAITIRQPASVAPARGREPNSNGLNVGFMGTLAPHKGILTLLATFRAAPDTWRLHLAGGGLLDGTIRAACATDERITHYGYVTGSRKNEFFDRLDVLVIPSEYEENAPLIAAEAAVRGLPCLVSDRGGLPETPEAWTFRAGDGNDLLEILERLWKHPELVTGASQNLLRARDDFLWPRHLERLEATYADAIDAAGVQR